MFATVPEFEIEVHDALKPSADLRHWGMVSIPTRAAWYVITLRASDGLAIWTLLLGSAAELLDVLSQRQSRVVVRLICMRSADNSGWRTHYIDEVWSAVHPRTHALQTVLVAAEGRFDAFFGDSADDLRATELVVRIAPAGNC